MKRLVSLVLSLGLAACAADEVDPAPPAATTLSLSFQNRCAVCHGERGEGIGVVPALPGKLDVAAFKAVVRNGRGVDMNAYGPEEVTDLDLEMDYRVLAQRPPR